MGTRAIPPAASAHGRVSDSSLRPCRKASKGCVQNDGRFFQLTHRPASARAGGRTHSTMTRRREFRGARASRVLAKASPPSRIFAGRVRGRGALVGRGASSGQELRPGRTRPAKLRIAEGGKGDYRCPRVRIEAIHFEDFTPFAPGELVFPRVPERPAEKAEVHILTGVNGSGKTRVLCALAAAFGDASALQSRCAGGLEVRFEVNLGEESHRSKEHGEVSLRVGESGVEAQDSRTQMLLREAQGIAAFAYAGTAYLRGDSADIRGGRERRKEEPASLEHRLSFYPPGSHSEDFVEALTDLILQDALDRKEGVPPTPQQFLLARILDTLREIVGPRIAFEVTRFPKKELRVHWNGEALKINHLPDGLRGLLGWVVDAALMHSQWCAVMARGAQRRTRSEREAAADPFAMPVKFFLDEPETHLHPAWQRKLLPAFQRLFPAAQIFVATHSPHIICSLNCGWIHRLCLGADGKVRAEKPHPASLGDSYVTVLAEIMGVGEWYDPETEALLKEFRELRDRGLAGDTAALTAARAKGRSIAGRSPELANIMHVELLRLTKQPAAERVAARAIKERTAAKQTSKAAGKG